jgi:uncharacterized membrane protein
MGFIVIPATKRLMFVEAAGMVQDVFLCAFARLALPWAIKTEFVQTAMGNFTEQMLQESQKFGGNSNPRLTIDEL